MNQAGQGLDRLFKTLANHSDLISEAYFNGVVLKNNQTQQALNKLKQLKVLVNHDDDSYRVAGRLSQFIDNALSSERVRRLDTDLASWIETLEQQIGLYQDAGYQNRVADGDSYFAEIERLVFDLADTLEENTRYLLMLVNSRFANVRTLAEKQKQNAFYISRLEKLVNAISALQPQFLLELVEEQPELYALLDRHLVRLLPVYQQRLQAILDKLKVFLFKLRQIEARAQLVQGFAFFLQQNQNYQPQDWSERDVIPEHWNQLKPLALSGHADLLDNALTDELIEIAQKIRLESAIGVAKQNKRLLNTVSLNPPAQKILALPLYRQYIARYFDWVLRHQDQAISAVAFYKTFVTDIEPAIWLSCVFNEVLRRQRSSAYQRLQMELRQVDTVQGFSGNKKVQDIMLKYLAAEH
ncbi:MAG: hypothetical protein HOP02_05075 [Methylococcaceae bacterium]|nr:hypothetical protein [Methylococcaceae bacterium]